jgi:biotin synthase
MAAQKANLEVCSGIIVGMGETTQDVIDVALELRQFNAPSIPVNFLVPIEGNVLKNPQNLTPNYCLRVLCLFRLLNPKAEIRVAAGREGHLRSLEIMALYPANSLFFEGYLNTKGASSKKTLQMIIDAGFTIESEININEILKNSHEEPIFLVDGTQEIMKGLQELRPAKV